MNNVNPVYEIENNNRNPLPPNQKFLIVIILLGLLIAFGIVYHNY